MQTVFNSPLGPSSPRSPFPMGFGSPSSTPDRFIANRAQQDATLSHFLLTTKENATPFFGSPERDMGKHASLSPNSSPPIGAGGRGALYDADPFACTKLQFDESGSPRESSLEREQYSTKLARKLFNDAPQTSVLGMHSQNGRAPPLDSEQQRYSTALGVVFEENRARNFTTKAFRLIPQTPERILDAADIGNDFYLNLLDWSSTNLLAVALKGSVFLWDASTSSISELPVAQGGGRRDTVCSVAWSGDGTHLATGYNDTEVEVWDPETQRCLRRFPGHANRVGSMSWSHTNVLSTGSKDKTIRSHDMRMSGEVSVCRAHTDEVCGLRWAPSGQQLASGGNDNQLMIWDARKLSGWSSPALRMSDHRAAVKALAWNPVQPNLLVSGGGTEDKTLRFWDTLSGEQLHTIDTGSQVCGAVWSHCGTQLVSAHGFSKNHLSIWKYRTLRRVMELKAHTARVLHLALSPDGQVVVSAGADETVRFWRCFPEEEVMYGRECREGSPPVGVPSSYMNRVAGKGSASPPRVQPSRFKPCNEEPDVFAGMDLR